MARVRGREGCGDSAGQFRFPGGGSSDREASGRICLPAAIVLCGSFGYEHRTVARSCGSLPALAPAEPARRRGWIVQSKTARRAGAGNWDFLASWRRGKQKRTSGEAPESGGPGRWRRNPDLWYPVLLVVAGILFFWDPLFSSKNFYFRDILNFHYPLHKIMIDSYARGEFPLWNPYVYLGQPMLANPNYMAFYPTNLFHLFLPFNYAFKLHFIVHPILGGLGLYFLQRRLGITALAAFGGSLVYQFSGPVLSFLNLYSIVQAVALMPWTGWALFRALYESGWGRILVFGAIL